MRQVGDYWDSGFDKNSHDMYTNGVYSLIYNDGWKIISGVPTTDDYGFTANPIDSADLLTGSYSYGSHVVPFGESMLPVISATSSTRTLSFTAGDDVDETYGNWFTVSRNGYLDSPLNVSNMPAGLSFSIDSETTLSLVGTLSEPAGTKTATLTAYGRNAFGKSKSSAAISLTFNIEAAAIAANQIWYYAPSEVSQFYDSTGVTSHTFDSNEKKGIISYSDPLLSSYSALRGNTTVKSVELPNGMTTISPSGFMGCTGLSSIILPSSLVTIGAYSLSGCSALTSVPIPNSVKTIDSSAFKECRNFTLSSLPASLTKINSSAFNNCRNITISSIPNSVNTIGTYAFANCYKMKISSIPSSLTKISNSAFSNCRKINVTSIPSKVKTIGTNAFLNCWTLSSMTVPSGLTVLSSNAFNGCSGLLNFTFEGQPNAIGASAFYKCSQLSAVHCHWYEGDVAGVPWGANTNVTTFYYLTQEQEVTPNYDSLVIYDDTINKMDDIRLDKMSGLTKNGKPVWSGTTRWLDKNNYTGDTYYLYAVSSQSKKGWVVSKTLPEEANPGWDNYITQDGEDYDGDGIIDDVYYEYADPDKYGARGVVSTFDTMPWQVDIWSYVIDMEGYGEEQTMQSGDFKIKALNTIEFPSAYYVIDTYKTDSINYTGIYQKQDTLISGIYPTYYDSVNNHSIVISKGTDNFGTYRNQNMWKFCNGAPDTTGSTNSIPSTPYFMKQENWGYSRYNFSTYDIHKTLPPAFGWYVNNNIIDNPSQNINDPKVGLSKFIVQTMPLQQIPASNRTGSFAHPYYWYDKVETNDGTATKNHAKYTPYLQKTADAGLPSPAGSGFAIYVYLQAGVEYKFGGNVNGSIKAGVMLCSNSGQVLASDYCTNMDPEDGSGYGGMNRTIHGIVTNSFFKYTPSQSGWYKFCGYMTGDDNEWDEADMSIRMYMDPVSIWGATTVTGDEYVQVEAPIVFSAPWYELEESEDGPSEHGASKGSYSVTFTDTGSSSNGYPIYSGTGPDNRTWYMMCSTIYDGEVYCWFIGTDSSPSDYSDDQAGYWNYYCGETPANIVDGMNFGVTEPGYYAGFDSGTLSM